MLTSEELEARLLQEKRIEKSNQSVSKYSHCIGRVRAVLSRTPIFGPLFDCVTEDHYESFREIFFNIFFATMPIWLGALLGYAYVTPKPETSYVNLLINGVSNGELFILSASILAPVLFSIWQDPKGAKPFPSKTSIGLAVLAIIIVCTGFFSAAKVNPIPNKNFTLMISIYLGIAALVLRYLSTVYHKNRIHCIDFKRSENQLQQDINAQRLSDE